MESPTEEGADLTSQEEEEEAVEEAEKEEPLAWRTGMISVSISVAVVPAGTSGADQRESLKLCLSS